MIGGTLNQSTPCTLNQSTTNYAIVQLPEWCSGSQLTCTANTQLQFTVSGFSNPNFLQTGTIPSVNISSMTPAGDALYDMNATSLSFTPSLQPNPVNDFVLARNGSTVIGGISDLNVTFTPTNYFNSISGILELNFPANAVYGTPSNVLVNGASRSFTTTTYSNSLSAISTLRVLNTCSGGVCLNNSQLVVTVQSVQNELSTYLFPNATGATDYFGITTYTSANMTISTGKVSAVSGFGGALVTNQTVPQLTITDLTVGVTTTYQLSFQPTVSLQSGANGGLILVQFPPEVYLTANLSCLASYGALVFTCALNQSAQTLTLTAASDVVIATNATQSVSVTLTGVRNPQTMQTSSTIQITSYFASTYAQQRWLLYATPLTAYALSVQLTRNDSVINNAISISVTLSQYNPRPSGNQIQISIPAEQAVFPNTTGSVVLSRVSTTTQQLAYVVVQNNASGFVIQFSETSCPCANTSFPIIY